MGDVLVVAVKRDCDNARALGGLDCELGFQWGGKDADAGHGLESSRRRWTGARGVVEGGLREVRYGDEDGLACAGLDLSRIDGEEDGLEAGEVGELGEVGGGRDNTGEVEAAEEGEEGEGDEAEVRVRGLVGVVEPLAERVVAGPGEGGGDGGEGGGGVEEGEGGAVGVGKEGEWGGGGGREDGNEGLDARAGSGDGFPP